MSYEERGNWVYLVACTCASIVYLAIVVSRLQSTPVSDVSYVPALLWTTGASTLASTLGRTLTGSARPGESRRSDVRDKEIYRFGECASRWCIVAGAGAALIMAMARVDYFWIANAIYLGFVLWAMVGSVLKLVAYRRGLQQPS